MSAPLIALAYVCFYFLVEVGMHLYLYNLYLKQSTDSFSDIKEDFLLYDWQTPFALFQIPIFREIIIVLSLPYLLYTLYSQIHLLDNILLSIDNYLLDRCHRKMAAQIGVEHKEPSPALVRKAELLQKRIKRLS